MKNQVMERGEVGQEGTEGGWFFSVTAQPGRIKPVSNTIQLLLFPYGAQAGLSLRSSFSTQEGQARWSHWTEILAVQGAWSAGTFDTISVRMFYKSWPDSLSPFLSLSVHNGQTPHYDNENMGQSIPSVIFQPLTLGVTLYSGGTLRKREGIRTAGTYGMLV